MQPKTVVTASGPQGAEVIKDKTSQRASPFLSKVFATPPRSLFLRAGRSGSTSSLSLTSTNRSSSSGSSGYNDNDDEEEQLQQHQNDTSCAHQSDAPRFLFPSHGGRWLNNSTSTSSDRTSGRNSPRCARPEWMRNRSTRVSPSHINVPSAATAVTSRPKVFVNWGPKSADKLVYADGVPMSTMQPPGNGAAGFDVRGDGDGGGGGDHCCNLIHPLHSVMVGTFTDRVDEYELLLIRSMYMR